MKIIKAKKMTKRHFTLDQLEKVKKQGKLLGAEKVKEAKNEWPNLIAKERTELEKGMPPESPEFQLLAKRWKELVNLFTGGDSGFTRPLNDTTRKSGLSS